MNRVGIGYDSHPLVSGRKLILAGVEISHHKGLSGHSDADVVCHAACDALLGALALGDIGKHFPPTDSRFKNISSLILLSKVMELVKSHSAVVVNLDLTIVAEEPKLASYTLLMRENLAKTMGAKPEQISVKCSTNNGLGFAGRKEGMACIAVVLLEKAD